MHIGQIEEEKTMEKIDEEKLIIAVQKRVVIYDKGDKNYHNRDIITASWEGVSKEDSCEGNRLLKIDTKHIF